MISPATIELACVGNLAHLADPHIDEDQSLLHPALMKWLTDWRNIVS
jgi:hypothetical protein